MSDPSDRDWLTVVEAATYLGVSENTIREAVRRGTIPHRKVGARKTIVIPETWLRKTTHA